MKKALLILIATIIAISTLSLISCTVANKMDYDDSGYTIGASSFDSGNIKGIDIEWINGNVNLQAKGSVVAITEDYDQNDSNLAMRYKVIDGVLHVKFVAPDVNYKNISKKLTVTYPADQIFDTFNVSCINGEVSAKVLNADDLTINVTDGNISVEDCSGKELSLANVEGNVSTTKTNYLSTSLSTANGNISALTLISKTASVNDVNGSITVSDFKLDGLTVKNTNGHVILGMTEHNKGYNLKSKLTNGDVYVDEAKSTDNEIQYGDGTVSINVEIINGNLHVINAKQQ